MNDSVYDNIYEMLNKIQNQVIVIIEQLGKVGSMRGLDPGIWSIFVEIEDAIKKIRFYAETILVVLGEYMKRRYSEPELGFA